MGRDELSKIYVVISVVAFFGMWGSVAVFALGPDGTLLGFLRALVANPAVLMLTIEMTCMAVASSLLMYAEAKRLRMRWAWLRLLLAITVGFGVVFPFFLARRQRRISPGAVADGPAQ